MESLSAIYFSHPLLFSYLGVINLIALFTYGVDKIYARAHAWRISERTLLLLALAGGSPGALTGIYLFRHESRKSIFLLYFSAILLVQIALMLAYFYPAAVGLSGLPIAID